jgi:GTP-binding protein
MLKINNAKFITSAASKSQFIQSDKPIIAVCGKSNVGKSSFINMLANQKKLAKVSQEPGRTRLINYFDFGTFILADLPGYGFARVSKAEKEKWAHMLDDFFAEKDKIAHVFSLCDIRHDPTDDDVSMVNFLYYHLIPFTVIATKADKISKQKVKASLNNIAAFYKCGEGNIIATSAQTRYGLESVLNKIEEIVNLSNKTEDNEEDSKKDNEQD